MTIILRFINHNLLSGSPRRFFRLTPTINNILYTYNNNKSCIIRQQTAKFFQKQSTTFFQNQNIRSFQKSLKPELLNKACWFSTNPTPSSDDPITKKQVSNKIFTLPNLLCMARIMATPLAGYLIIENEFQTALAVCVVSSLTDFLDGWLARTFNLESKLGAILDPLADKLLVATLTITLTYMQMIPLFLCGLIFLRDFLILLGAFWMRFQMVQPPITFGRYFDMSTFSSDRYRPTLISKINTGFQFSLVLITLSSPLFDGFFRAYPLLLPMLQWTTGVTTLWSGLDYIKRLNIKKQPIK